MSELNVNKGYITNQGLKILLSKISNNINQTMDLDLFNFGIGKRDDFLIKSKDLSSYTFHYDENNKKFVVNISQLNLTQDEISRYKYLYIKNKPYKIGSIDAYGIVLDFSENYTDTDYENVVIQALAEESTITTGKVLDIYKETRTIPEIDSSKILIKGSIADIKNYESETGKIEVLCIIDENPNLSEPIIYDEIYLFGATDPDKPQKLIFVAELNYGEGVFTGVEKEVFSFTITINNVDEDKKYNYTISNLSLKDDIDIMKLMFIYLQSSFNRHIRDIKNDLIKLENSYNERFPENLLTLIQQRLEENLYKRFSKVYKIEETELFSTEIRLFNEAEIDYNVLYSDKIPGFSKVVGFIPKKVEENGEVKIHGYPSNYLFYIDISNKIKCYDIDNNKNVPLKGEYANMIFTEYDNINIDVLTELCIGFS